MKNILCDYLHNFIGFKYVWGGDDAWAGGFDCSGLVLEGLRSIGLWGKADDNAQGIYNKFKPIYKQPASLDHRLFEKGDLLFFGPDTTKINHVAVYCGFGQMIEAGGGDASSKSGMVRKRLVNWRKDLVACIKL